MKPTLRLMPLLEPIRPQMEQVERLLQETLAQAEEPLGSMLHHSLDGGKRLRPALVILAGQLFVPSAAPFHSLAAATELLHTATLIHDDLVDGAALRRGRKTLHTAWSVGMAVLAGDYLLGQSARLVAELECPCILKDFAETLCTMSAGEIGQICITGPHDLREQYYHTIETKTASLCAIATKMAGILAGATEPQIAALRRYGQGLGLAFQIADDVLDFTGDEMQLGKPAGSDLRQGIVTLPTICYLETVEDGAAVETVLAGQRDVEHVRVAIEAVCASGAVEAALTEARGHARQSQSALAALPDGPAHQMLYTLAGYVVERKH